MAYRVAVASSDGKFINEHFGRSKQFLIFEITETDDYRFLELRENIPACNSGEHDEDQMDKSIDLLSDCRLVLVSQIGPGAERKLEAKGITAYRVPDFIDDALKKLVQFESKKHHQ